MMKKAIRILKSIRLAVALIFILAALSLIGIFVPQIPANYSATPDGYAWWVENTAHSQMGDIVYSLEPLGLFHVFHSAWFIGAASLLMVNILICTVLRVKILQAGSQKTIVDTEAEFYKQGKYIHEIELTQSIKRLDEIACKTLENWRYSISRQDSPETVYIAGDKRRFFPWGTLAVHTSLMLLVAGVLVSVLFGFADDSFVVAEGTARDIGNGTGLSVYLKSFADEYWNDGTPKDYSSDVELYKNGAMMKNGVIRVNHPMNYQGVRIHQGFFGQAAKLMITDANGKTIFQDNVLLSDMRVNDSLHRPEGKVKLPGDNYNVILLGSAINGSDPYISKDQLGIEFYDKNMKFIGWLVLEKGAQRKFGSLFLSYENLQYSGFLVSREPGTSLVWSAAFLFLFGIGMIFYFPRRHIWVKMHLTSENSTRVYLKLEAQRDFGLDDEMAKLIMAFETNKNREGSQ